MKRLEFLGDSVARLREFPEDAKKEAGVQLHKVQQGIEPSDWKPMPTVGPSVRQIRIREDSGAFRVLYVAHMGDAVVPRVSEEDAADAQEGFRPRFGAPEADLGG